MTREHPTLIDEFLARRLVQWSFGYVAGAWILLELTDFLAELFAWPEVIVRVALTVFAFGFLAVIVIAWHHGEKGRQAVTRREVALLSVIGVVGLGTAGSVALGGAGGDGAALTQAAVARSVPDDPRDAPAAIAVLPFVNLSGTADDDAFADGVTEDIIAQLSRIPQLRVISRTSVMQYRGTSLSLVEIGRELSVDFVLEGSARRVDDQVRIVAQLIDARTDEHVWSETYDRELSDILRIQADVAERIAEALAETFAPMGGMRFAADAGEVDDEAYRLLTRGRRLARSEEEAERAEGHELLAQAVERDPGLLRALAAMPEALVPERMDPVEVMDAMGAAMPEGSRLRTVIERAIEAEDTPADVRAALRWRIALVDGDVARAESAANEAIRANPNDAEARRWYGLLLARRGAEGDAVEHLQIARSLDPRSLNLGVDMGEVLSGLGRHQEALRELEAVVVQRPDHVPAQIALGLAYHGAGQSERGIAVLERASDASGGHPAALGALGYLLAETGDEAGARAVLDSLDARGAPGVFASRIHATLGDTAAARAAAERDSGGGRRRVPDPPGA